ncbi:hypothetical protein CONPUDRAFT_74936 [Coniophora puteana RWD-64-598 SS2]|uniref:Uncharacterized protein n=1 Tax=Coniophora puteana (strain RWD-64-598) TaxID=741705 RepID=A0A5M3MGQ8_CONPW|nr:uncharacterized protein CONPUDRAFT_74936 [Coniophora puteana RWD-64-598 SS2]EIW78186.1 hypothetical protein CONPUDRAFT_74936 [Coniophora puteana RWD-64-598 SS2]
MTAMGELATKTVEGRGHQRPIPRIAISVQQPSEDKLTFLVHHAIYLTELKQAICPHLCILTYGVDLFKRQTNPRARDVSLHNRLNTAMSTLRDSWRGTIHFRNDNAQLRQANSEVSDEHLTRSSSRVSAAISPAYGRDRIRAAGEAPGRPNGGNTTPLTDDDDDDDDDSDSLIPVGSYQPHPFVDVLCFCNFSALRGRHESEPRHTRMRNESAPAREPTTQRAPTAAGTGPPLDNAAAGSTSAPEQTELASIPMHTYPPSS